MTSSEVRQTSYTRRFFWFAVFILFLIGGYSALWYYLAGRLENSARMAMAALNHDGVIAECANAEVRGYPFRLGLFCDSLGYENPATNIAATAGSLRSAAQIYEPTHIVGELDGPLRTAIPGIAPLWLDWDNLRASVRLASPFPERLSMEAEGLSAQTDPEDGDPVPLFSADRMEGHLRPNGADIDWAGSFAGLEIDPVNAGGRELPVLAGSGDATLKNGLALLGSNVQNLRGQAADIRQLDLSSGEAGVSVAGPVSVGEDGLIDASLTIKVRNLEALSAILAKAFPEAQSQIRSGFAGLAMLGSQQSLPLRITKGKATLGFIPLGNIPPL